MADAAAPDSGAGAGAASDPKSKAPVKASKSIVAEGGDTKKRFEVKKVGLKGLTPSKDQG